MSSRNLRKMELFQGLWVGQKSEKGRRVLVYLLVQVISVQLVLLPQDLLFSTLILL